MRILLAEIAAICISVISLRDAIKVLRLLEEKFQPAPAAARFVRGKMFHDGLGQD